MSQQPIKGFVLAAEVLPPVTRTQIVRYQGASGDMDAAHHDDEHAKAYGYTSAFSLGMLHAGELSAFLARAFPGAVIVRLSSKFKTVVYPKDQLTFAGSVIDASTLETGNEIGLQLKVTNQQNEIVIVGAATLRFQDGEAANLV